MDFSVKQNHETLRENTWETEAWELGLPRCSVTVLWSRDLVFLPK